MRIIDNISESISTINDKSIKVAKHKTFNCLIHRTKSNKQNDFKKKFTYIKYFEIIKMKSKIIMFAIEVYKYLVYVFSPSPNLSIKTINKCKCNGIN